MGSFFLSMLSCKGADQRENQESQNIDGYDRGTYRSTCQDGDQHTQQSAYHTQYRIADRAGKITSAEISREPTRFIASTIITPTTTAIRRL